MRRFPASRKPRAARALPALLATGLAAAALASCGAVTVPAGPYADDRACADLVLGVPSTLLGQDRRETTSQGSVAWGSGESTVVMRCGVEPPPPTTERCTRLEDTSGSQVDWIVSEDEASGIVRFTTYGRSPAVDLTVPRALAPDQPSAAALDLGPLVAQIEATEHCLGAEDL